MAISKVPSSGITADFDNSLTTADLAPNSVDSSELVDGSIDTSHIADDQVTGAKLANDIAITTTGALTGTTGDFNWDSNTLVVDSSESRVGIGEASPAYALDCKSDADGTWAARVWNTDSGNPSGLLARTTDDNGTGHIFAAYSGSSYKFAITPSGNVGIGTDAPDERLHVMESSAGSVTAHSESSIVAERSGNSFISILGSSTSGLLFGDAGGNETGRINYEFSAGAMKFYTENAERMRIDSSGNVGVGDSNMGENRLKVVNDSLDGWVGRYRGRHPSDGNGIQMYLAHGAGYGMHMDSEGDPNNTSIYFIECVGPSAKFRVYSNGTVQNVDGTYGSALSDERLKINIKDANSQWEDVKNINIVNYKRLVDGADSRSLLSVIAQQVKEVSPGLIGERPPDSDEIKANPTFGTLYEEGDDIPEDGIAKVGSVKEVKENVLFFKDSIFFWKCAKALQEAMVKIETLEAKVTTLENA